MTTQEYPTPASRPAYSILSTDKICAMNLKPSPWRRQLRIVVSKLLSQ
ncbi:MAG: NAD(P)-dependent oxidoreductase [Serratia liquefaciens]|nr:NAD(P)-dependent oxidoreductase [Serratia liquefaciens]